MKFDFKEVHHRDTELTEGGGARKMGTTKTTKDAKGRGLGAGRWRFGEGTSDVCSAGLTAAGYRAFLPGRRP